ncbi:LuxR C-terminal-related transcriptional regulator [Streptomyces sp. NPDC046727]|uniref:helix-turn-helix transcriptional regulator n=1 Tax=Streptomyces sp. NPDC046727 TaxID=3155373 RepID=UPI0033C5420D
MIPLMTSLRTGTKRIGRKAERGQTMQKPMFLRVLWVVSDEVSLYGLTALLDLVGSVSQYEVCLDVSAAEKRLREHSFDVCVLPVERYTTQVGELADRCGSLLVLTLPAGKTSEDFGQVDRRIAHWLPQHRITLSMLQRVFLGFTEGMHRPVDLAPAGDRAMRLLHRVTEREREVLRLLAQAQSNQQIARCLGISIHGVKRHVSNLLLKFDCSNRTELALAASQLQIDLVRPPGAAVRTGVLGL